MEKNKRGAAEQPEEHPRLADSDDEPLLVIVEDEELPGGDTEGAAPLNNSKEEKPSVEYVADNNAVGSRMSVETNIGRSRQYKRRHPFTKEQRYALQQEFLKNKTPSAEERNELASKIHLNPVQVMIWFQNRRHQMRRANKAEEKKRQLASILSITPTSSVFGHGDISHIADNGGKLDLVGDLPPMYLQTAEAAPAVFDGDHSMSNTKQAAGNLPPVYQGGPAGSANNPPTVYLEEEEKEEEEKEGSGFFYAAGIPPSAQQDSGPPPAQGPAALGRPPSAQGPGFFAGSPSPAYHPGLFAGYPPPAYRPGPFAGYPPPAYRPGPFAGYPSPAHPDSGPFAGYPSPAHRDSIFYAGYPSPAHRDASFFAGYPPSDHQDTGFFAGYPPPAHQDSPFFAGYPPPANLGPGLFAGHPPPAHQDTGYFAGYPPPANLGPGLFAGYPPLAHQGPGFFAGFSSNVCMVGTGFSNFPRFAASAAAEHSIYSPWPHVGLSPGSIKTSPPMFTAKSPALVDDNAKGDRPLPSEHPSGSHLQTGRDHY
jgi:hypothetical protein